MLKSEFLIEAIIIFDKKRHQVVYSLYAKASNSLLFAINLPKLLISNVLKGLEIEHARKAIIIFKRT